MSSELKTRLELLYQEKKRLEEEIRDIEFRLSQSFSTQEKIEIFYTLFLKNSTKKYSQEEIKSHLLGYHKLIYEESLYTKYNFIMFSINKEDLEKILNLLKQSEIDIFIEYPNHKRVNAWIFFEYDYDFSIYKKIKFTIKALLEDINVDFYKKFSLPLNLKDIEQGFRLFVDKNQNKPFRSQWGFLNSLNKITHFKVLKIINKNINLVLDSAIHIPNNIDFLLLKEIKAMLTFENPAYQMLRRLRKPLYNTPKLIKNYKQTKDELIVPRGFKNSLFDILNAYKIKYNIIDNRVLIKKEPYSVKYGLRNNQQQAIEQLIESDYGICVAPPGFGKTLIGAKMIELRVCNVLILVNKSMLLDQWVVRLSEYFGVDKKEFGILGKSKNSLNQTIDIATIQSIKNNLDIIKEYSFLIIDECHHIPAYSFESIIKEFRGRYALGLSATPYRKDGLEPLLFHQIGEIVYEESFIKKSKNQLVHLIESDFVSNSENYSEILAELIKDEKRNSLIVDQAIKYKDRNVILLSDRVEHIEILQELLKMQNLEFVVIHGSQSKKEQSQNQAILDKSNFILSSSAYFGEGVDLEHLDTIIFATPISYYGRIIQYLGRIGRSTSIEDTLCIDILDVKNPILLSTYKKRKEGYAKLGYKLINISLR